MLAALVIAAGAASGVAVAAPGWTAPQNFVLPANAVPSAAQIAYQSGGTATVAYLEVDSATTPIQTVLHVGVIAPGGNYQEQLRIPSTSTSAPGQVSLAVAPNGAAVIEWLAYTGTSTTSPFTYLASYRPAGSSTWQAPATLATDTTTAAGINPTLSTVISTDGTAAAGIDHLDPTVSPAGYRIDVAVHPASGSWGAATQISPPSPPTYLSSESLALGIDAQGNITAAFTLRMGNDRYTLAVENRPASSGIWSSLQDVTGSDATSSVDGLRLGVAPDGSAVIAFQYVHYAAPNTLDVNAVTRSGPTGSWTAVTDVVPGGASSDPLAAAMSPSDKAYVLYWFQGISSGQDCVGAIRAPAGGTFSSPQCVSATNFQFNGGAIAFLGNDAYLAWTGQPNGGTSSVPEGSVWLDGAAQPGTFTDLDSPSTTAINLDGLVPDQDGSVVALWATNAGVLRDSAFDAGGPNLISAGVPSTGVVGQPISMSASFVDLWSGVPGAPGWSFGDGGVGSGASVSHTFSAAGTYTIKVTADDGLGNATTSSYPITITPATGPGPGTPAPQTTAAKFGNQQIKLTTPSLTVCTAKTTTLSVKLASTAILHSHATKLKFASAGFYLDKGVKHTRKKTVHSKHGSKTIHVTTYTANATAHHVPVTLALRLSGLKSGSHTLTVVSSYTETVIKHGHKKTVTVKKTVTAKFKVC